MLVAGLSLPAAAQEIPDQGPAGVLPDLPFLNVFQRDVAQGIDRVCPTLVTARQQGQLDPTAAALSERCTEMVATGRALQGAEGVENVLGLTEQGLAEALGAIHGEELQTPRTQIAELRTITARAVGNRLLAIRTGLGGVNLAGVTLPPPAANQLASLEPVELAQTGTGDDDGDGDADGLISRLGAFVTGGLGWSEVDTTEFARGFDSDSREITAGVDYRLTDNLALGVALGYADFEADFAGTGGQTPESDTVLVHAYGTYYVGERLYLDAILTYGRSEYDSTRRIVYATFDETATGNFDTDLYSASLNGGYTLPIRPVTTILLVGVDALHAEVDGFTETGADEFNLRFDDSEIDSFRTLIGAEASYPLSTDIGVIQPAVFARWIHEFANEGTDTRVVYAADPTNLSAFVITDAPTDEDYFNVGAYVSTQFAGNLSGFVSYDTLLGLEDVESHLVQLGLRYEF